MGYEAYPVGGCVRDVLLGREPGDWDVTTSALPWQVQALFEHTIPTGLAHGTVTVRLEKQSIEVTTFRSDGDYTDGRHPAQVCFGGSLTGDLARRDFTVNAMALDRTGKLIDPFDGAKDLKNRLLRCVGEPEKRFGEDALRMLRGVRFSAQLGFELEVHTRRAILDCAHRAMLLSAERVRTELEKTLCSPHPERAGWFFEFGLLRRWTETAAVPSLPHLGRCYSEPLHAWTALAFDLLRGGSITHTDAFLHQLRLDGETERTAAAAVEILQDGVPKTELDWRRRLATHGKAAAEAAATVEGDTLLSRVLEQNPCYQVRGLALSGGELQVLGYTGQAIGAAQRALLEHVLEHPDANEKSTLMVWLKTRQW